LEKRGEKIEINIKKETMNKDIGGCPLHRKATINPATKILIQIVENNRMKKSYRIDKLNFFSKKFVIANYDIKAGTRHSFQVLGRFDRSTHPPTIQALSMT